MAGPKPPVDSFPLVHDDLEGILRIKIHLGEVSSLRHVVPLLVM